ncbi:MAG: 30S ribosomal protein S12 methylthiotransferase RimO [Candidatus Cloacimonetes bacterium HGW-Cloacimonetes-1]|jgi:ribosomal protein S12 methylthiotransferase|nr:MAG: 30S ribosomal protein S12 methylthiotransferase RimO [Candidatus Cloacimonetes bacterium HGW-Cloacimonetes-1]
MKTYYLESLGCAKNLVDSEVFAFILEKHGYQQSDEVEGADLVLVNTCAFLQESLREVDEVLSWIADYKKGKSIGKLIVTGCLMNRAGDEFASLFPEVDAWIGLKDFEALDILLSGSAQKDYQRIALDEKPYAYLRISDGCNNHCAYCMIPSIRGELQSVPMEDLISEARILSKRGIRELIVIAQDTCSYGRDLYGEKKLPELLTRLHEVEGLSWIRVMYLHPDNFETSWLPLFRDLPKLLPYFEMPIQHCNDKILHAMNRKKGKEELKSLFDEVLTTVPEAVLRTTLIVGFPGETPAIHKEMQAFLSEVPFMHLGTFEYSAEPETPAFKMRPQVTEKKAEMRSNELISLHRELMTPLLQKMVGTELTVLIEGIIETDEIDPEERFYLGRAWFQSPEIDGIVEVQGQNLQIGDMVVAEVEDVIDIDLFAVFVRMLPTP